MSFIVAIDGPVGSGKSSVAREVAMQLGFAYVDTGAVYRALALEAVKKKISWDDEGGLSDLAMSLDVEFKPDKSGQKTYLNGKDVSLKIRTEEMSQGASISSQYGKVRKNLLELQRKLGLASEKGSVLEGRDIGTVVFPKAQIKLYLKASDEERARRRFEQLEARGEKDTYKSVLDDLRERDSRDKDRKVAPLKIASDALVIVTDGKSKDEVVQEITDMVMKVYQDE